METTHFISTKKTKIGKEAVVVIPIKEWNAIEDALENLAALNSKKLRGDIRRARNDVKHGRTMTLDEVEAKLGLT